MYDVIKNYPRPDEALVARYGKMVGESASIHECMGRTGAMDCTVRPVWPGTRLCGVALTVHTRAADNLVLHKALDMARPGDALVVCCEGFVEAGGMWGGMMTASAIAKGAVGLVTDGSVRDTVFIREQNFPVYARGISVKGTSKALPGTINHPVIVGGVRVCPGDIIFGDNDAVVVIPRERAKEVLELTMAREAKEEEILAKIRSGEGTTFNLNGFDKLYQALGLTEEP